MEALIVWSIVIVLLYLYFSPSEEAQKAKAKEMKDVRAKREEEHKESERKRVEDEKRRAEFLESDWYKAHEAERKLKKEKEKRESIILHEMSGKNYLNGTLEHSILEESSKINRLFDIIQDAEMGGSSEKSIDNLELQLADAIRRRSDLVGKWEYAEVCRQCEEEEREAARKGDGS